MAILLHPFVRGVRATEQTETWLALLRIAKALPELPVVHKNCREDDDYDELLEANWAHGEDLVIVEMDVVLPGAEPVVELLACPEPYCMFSYSTHPEDGLAEDTVYALGCTKIANFLQLAAPKEYWFRKGTWHDLDQRIRRALLATRLPGCTGHYHGPPILKHNHRRSLVVVP
jgi:hypothetical protein